MTEMVGRGDVTRGGNDRDGEGDVTRGGIDRDGGGDVTRGGNKRGEVETENCRNESFVKKNDG